MKILKSTVFGTRWVVYIWCSDINERRKFFTWVNENLPTIKVSTVKGFNGTYELRSGDISELTILMLSWAK